MKAFWMTMTLPMPTQTTIKSLDSLAIMSPMTGCRREQGSKKPSLPLEPKSWRTTPRVTSLCAQRARRSTRRSPEPSTSTKT